MNATGSSAIRPGRWLYGLAIVLAVTALAAMVAGIAYFARSIHTMGSDMQRVDAPGEGVVRLDQPGQYIIYHEYQGVRGNRPYMVPAWPAWLRCRVVREETGEELPVTPTGRSETYNLGNTAGQSMWRFQADAPGEYRLISDYTPGTTGPPTVLAVSQEVLGRVGWTIASMFLGIGSAFVFGGAALVVFLVTFFKRRSARRRLAPVPMARLAPPPPPADG